MHIRFWSSHPSGDYSAGKLIVRVETATAPAIAPTMSEVWFRVPPDFHTHNDSVAAALMTLVGRRSPSVAFNFPISRRCAATLAGYYSLADIGPVDDALESRVPGRLLALNFSGGLDSVALWVLLREHVRIPFKVITTEYEGHALERQGYSSYARDVSVATNLRRAGFDGAGRFNLAAPLLFADYADLWGVASAHTMNQYPYSFESLACGETPAFLVQDAVLNAGGLNEVHLVRGLFEPGMCKLLVLAAPERIREALAASGGNGGWKRAVKALTLHHFAEQAGVELPSSMQNIRIPSPDRVRRESAGIQFRQIWMYSRLGAHTTARIDSRTNEHDMSFLDELSLDCFERYDTNLVSLIPSSFRGRLLEAFHDLGVYPYDERDFNDLSTVRRFMADTDNEAIADSIVARLSDVDLLGQVLQFRREAASLGPVIA